MEDAVVRPVAAADRDAWVSMRTSLWPGSAADHASEADGFLAGDVRRVFPSGEGVVLIAVVEGRPVGFLELGLRSVADGCHTSPVGYLEGIWVDPGARRRGVGRRLVDAGETWAKERGCSEMGSDALLENRASHAWHVALGYREVDRQVTFRREIARALPPTGAIA